MHEQTVSASPVRLVYLVAPEDEACCKQLDRHLPLLQRPQLLTTWSPQQSLAGTEMQREMDTQFGQASIIVLLLSSDFIKNDTCCSMMQQAVASGKWVVPVLVRPCLWELTAIGHLIPLPRNGKSILVQPNPEVALQEIAREIYTHIDPQGAAARLHPLGEDTSVADPKRQRFLNLLHTHYTNMLNQSLQGVTPIPLRLQTKPDAVVFPPNLVFRNFNPQIEEVLPLETSLVEIYEKAGGKLLVLGEPGAGKSTLLLRLALDLLALYRQGNQHFLPVIVDLSSWAAKRQPLALWLVEALHLRYQQPVGLGQQWVESDHLLVFLDGLDEVEISARSDCIHAINTYQREHFVPLIVSSRTTDYLSQQYSLEMQSAVIVQPLKPEEVDGYLTQRGSSLAVLRAALQQNSVLQELAATPLMLSVMTQTYRNSSVAILPEVGSLEEQQREVFDHYVTRMLFSNGRDQFSNGRDQNVQRQRFLAQLAWLAQQMRQHGQTTFYLEQLQPSWLTNSWKFVYYYWLAVRLPGIIMGILVIFAVDLALGPGHSGMPSISLILLGGLLGGLFSGKYENQHAPEGEVRAASASWVRWFLRFSVSVLVFLGIALDYERYQLNADLSLDLRLLRTPAPSLLFGILLLQVLLGNKNGAKAHPTTQAIWQRFIKSPVVRNGLLVGLLLWLGLGLGYALYEMRFGLSYARNAGLSYGLSYGLGYGLSFGLSSGLLSMLLIGSSTQVQPTDLLSWSWGSLKKSLFSKSHLNTTLLVSMSSGLIVGLSAGLSTGLSYEFRSGAIHVLDSVLSSGLSSGLSFGLSYWFLFGLFQSVSSETIEDHRRTILNQGIRDSALNGVRLGLISALFVGLNYALFVGLSYVMRIGLESILRYEDLGNGLRALNYGLSFALGDGLNSELSAGLQAGVSFGLLVCLYRGGLAYLRHYVLRILLRLSESNPWNYLRFLNQAKSCIFLLQVGGGYSFIHRLFLDYVADHSMHHPYMSEQNQTATHEDSAETGGD